MNITELLENRSDILLKPVTEREGAIVSYRVILVALIRELRQEFNATVLPFYKAHRSIQTDAESWFASLRNRALAAIRRAVDKMSRLFWGESASHLQRVVRSVQAGTKINLPTAVANSIGKESELIQNYIEKNTSLIKSLSDDIVKRMEQIIYDAKLADISPTQLSKRLQKQLGITKSRADLIAVDQMASLNSDLTEMRHKILGLDWYVWRDRDDGRVRNLHVSLRGKRYKWGEKTGAEDGLPPGKPIRCRCHAIAVIPAKPVAAQTSRSAIGR